MSETQLPIEITLLDPDNKEHAGIVSGPLLSYMRPLFEPYYPAFSQWYESKIVDEFTQGRACRRCISIVTDSENIHGVAIASLSRDEHHPNKISSFYVSPALEMQGIGRELFTRSHQLCAEFGRSRDTVLTVAEDRMELDSERLTLVGLIQHAGFRVIDVLRGQYRPGKNEYVFSDASPFRFHLDLGAKLHGFILQ